MICRLTLQVETARHSSLIKWSTLASYGLVSDQMKDVEAKVSHQEVIKTVIISTEMKGELLTTVEPG